MDSEFSFKIESASAIKADADEFYRSCGSAGAVDPTDILVRAFHNQRMVGNVRLCSENGCFVLRTMRIADHFQRRGLGSQILKQIKELLSERKIIKIYCIPYAHLEFFYGQIGFRRISSNEAPKFLQDRLKKMQLNHPQNSYILMAT